MRTVEKIRALCDAATPGPWFREIGGYDVYSEPRDVCVAQGDADTDTNIDEVGPNSDFIAASRTDIPDLLDALAAKDETIRCLNIDLEKERAVGEIAHETHVAELAEKDAEIERLNGLLIRVHHWRGFDGDGIHDPLRQDIVDTLGIDS